MTLGGMLSTSGELTRETHVLHNIYNNESLICLNRVSDATTCHLTMLTYGIR